MPMRRVAYMQRLLDIVSEDIDEGYEPCMTRAALAEAALGLDDDPTLAGLGEAVIGVMFQECPRTGRRCHRQTQLAS